MVQLAPEEWQASHAHVPSLPIHNHSAVHNFIEVQTFPPPSITALKNGLSARALAGWHRLGERFQRRRDIPLSVYSMPGSIQRGAFFLVVEGQKEAVPVVSRSLSLSGIESS